MTSKINLLLLKDYEIKDLLKKGYITVAIFGLGHVGLPLACAWLRAGAKVIGVAKSRETVEKINKGENPLRSEPSLSNIIKKFVIDKKFYATNNGSYAVKRANVIIITVPTGVKWNEPNRPLDLSVLINVLKIIGKNLSVGKLVITESTLPPGTTLNLIKPFLETTSNLKVEKDFGLAYSPERITSGHALHDIEEHYPKIISGVGPRSLKVVKAFYDVIAKKGTIALSSPTTAEFEKIAEGIYRDVNIALANELAKLAHKLKLDFNEIIRAANSQPYCHLHKPGVGVGGACIPIYPYFVFHTALKYDIEPVLAKLARVINETMPMYVANLAIKALKKLNIDSKKAKVAVLGLAFRGNISDTRLSPTIDLISCLESLGINNIVIHDPYVEDNPTKYPLERNLTSALKDKDLVIIATDHSDYYDLTLKSLSEMMKKREIAIVDGRNIIKLEKPAAKKKIVYVGVGRPWICINT